MVWSITYDRIQLGESIFIWPFQNYFKLRAFDIGSVTRLGNIFDFGQPFKAFGNN